MEDQLIDSGSIGHPTSQDLKVSHDLDFDVRGDDRLISILYRKVESMEDEIHELKTKKIIDDTQFPIEVLESNGLLPHKARKLKRGSGYRPLLQSEIEEAKKHSPFAAGQARWMGVSISTYRKYSELYGIYEPKPNHKGKKQPHDPHRGKFPLVKILEGELNDNPSVSDWMVRDKIIRSGTFPARCNICGYNKRRIVDRKISLLLDHKDGNKGNFKRENLQLLCFNCTFECGRGYIRRGNHMFDPDWIEGANVSRIDPSNRW